MPPSFSGRTTLVSGNVTIAGRRTSMRLEPEMWAALKAICARERLSIHAVCTLIDERRGEGGLTSAVRTFMVKYYEGAATEEGHERAGHGSGAPFGWGGGAGRATINQGEPAETLELETEEA